MRSLVFLIATILAYGLFRGIPESWPVALRGALGVMVISLGFVIWSFRRGGETTVRSVKRISCYDYFAVAAGVLLIECLLLGFLSVAPSPLEKAAAAVESWMRPDASARRQQAGGGEGANNSGNWLWDDAGERKLPQRTNFKPGDQPEVMLEPQTEADRLNMLGMPLYLQAFALSRHEDDGWSADSETSEIRLADNDGWLRFDRDRKGRAVACRVFRSYETLTLTPLTGLQGLIAARVPAAENRGSGMLLVGRPGSADTADGLIYETLSRPRTLDDIADQPRAGSPPNDETLRVPDTEMGRRISNLSRRIGGEGPAIDQLRRLRDHFQKSFAYSLVTSNPENRDPLENFLFYERRGHCELFATAGVLGARSLGIPARMAYGWFGGTYYESGNRFVFRAREAHAWTEVWLNGYGWVVMDPTPPVGLGRSIAERAPTEEVVPKLLVRDRSLVKGTEWPFWRGALVVGITLGLLAVVLRGLRTKGTQLDASPQLSKQGVAGLWIEFRRECQRRGIQVRPGWTLRRMVSALEIEPDLAAEILDYYYGVRYEDRVPAADKERNLIARFASWRMATAGSLA